MTKDPTIIHAIKRHAAEIGEKLCVADKRTALNYRDFFAKVLGGANFLASCGVKKGDIVSIKAYQNVEFVVTLFSVQALGAIACPIEKTASAIRSAEVASQIGSSFYVDTVLWEGVSCRYVSMEELYECQQMSPDVEAANLNLVPQQMSDIIFTTGTTGKSKGILVSHGTNVAIAENVIDSVAMSPDEVELITSPTSHSLALRRIYGAMWIGSTVVLADNFLFYDNFFSLLERYKVTAITFVPAILNLILELSKDRLAQYNVQLNYIQLGSAPLSENTKKQLIRMLPDVRLYNTYGATESGCTIILEFSKFRNKKNCIGRTTVNTKLYFVDDENNKIEARDEATAGKMVFQGNMNMSGYINEPNLTREVLKDGCIYTNDIGYIAEDGLVYLLGREGEVINSGGLKINPSEVEECVMGCGGVEDCAVIPVKDIRLGETPKLLVVAKSQIISATVIKNYISERLESYKIPVNIEFIDEIPRTFNGKIRRKELIDRYSQAKN